MDEPEPEYIAPAADMHPTSANKGPKACTTCAKAKARCIPGLDPGSKCERCQRLGKDCFSRLPAPPRAKKVPKRSRVAELEKRLDELSSQFEGAATGTGIPNPALVVNPPSESDGSPASASTSNKAQTPSTTPSSAVTAAAAAGGPAPRKFCGEKGAPDILNFEHLFPSPGSETVDSSACSPDVPKAGDGLWPLLSEAEQLFQQFQDLYVPHCPFLLLPKHLPAAELHRRRPFLWKSIMMVSCFFDGARHLRMGQEVLDDVGRALISDGMKNLEFLQGLLIIIGWFNYAMKGSQLTNLLFLARATCVNLDFSGNQCHQEENEYGQLEHIRAYLGTYYLNTLVFTTNKKIEAFMNTSQLETLCNILEAAAECPADKILVGLVKIQQLAQSISLTMLFDPAQPKSQLPVVMLVESFREQLDTYRSSLPTNVINNPTIRSHMAIAEALLMDVAISDQHANPTIMPVPDRLQLLWGCREGLRKFVTVRCLEREVERPRFISLTASDLAYVIITGMRLLMVKVPGWDPKGIVENWGMAEMIDKEIWETGQQAERRQGGLMPRSKTDANTAREDPMMRLHKLLKYAKELFNLQLQKLEAGSDSDMGSDSHRETPGHGWSMEDLDDDVWQNFMNDSAWTTLNGDAMMMDIV